VELIVSGAILVAQNEQENRGRGSGAPISTGHIVWDVRWTAALRPAGGRWFSGVCRPQTGHPVGRGRVFRSRADVQPVIRGLCPAPIARQAAWIGRGGRGTGIRRYRVRVVGRDPRGFAARSSGHHQKASARRRRRSVNLYIWYMPVDLNFKLWSKTNSDNIVFVQRPDRQREYQLDNY